MPPPSNLGDEARRIARVVTILAATLAVCVAVSVPLGYLYTAWQYETAEVENATRDSAMRLSRHIFGNARMWTFEVLRLGEILAAGRFGPWPVQQRMLHAPDDALILEVGAAIAWPAVRREADLRDGDVRVGRLIVVRSATHVLVQTATTAVASTLLGFAIFFSVRLLPLRLVRATFRRLEETLVALRARDLALADHKRTLEADIARRTDQLSTANADLERMLAELRTTKEAAEAASRAKSRFLAVMSHEIRTPMNAVLALAGTLLDDALTDEQRNVVGTIRDSGDSLMRIIDDILDYSKLDAGRMAFELAPFAPDTLTASLASILGAAASAKGLTLTTKLAPGLPAGLLGDAGRIRQVLLNLVSNAVKFTERGGVVVAVHDSGRSAIGGPERAIVEWSVSDTGIGIPPDAVAGLFGEFIQADTSITRRFGGSGLGLAISKRLVENMGGTIGVDSQPGQGTVFRVRLVLPLAERPASLATPRGDARRRFRAMLHDLGRPLHMLLAEDNATNQFVARQLLKGLDVRLDVVDNGREAVEAVAALIYDVVCMDMRMPEMDGLQATRLIRTGGGATAGVPIIALTANAFPEDVQACLDAGMNGFLSKPVRRDDLLAALCAAVAPPLSPDRPSVPSPAGEGVPDAVACDRVALDALAAEIGADGVAMLHAMFVAETRTRLVRLATPLDPDTCLREVHTLKGAADSVCASRLAALAGVAERRLKVGGTLHPADLRAFGAAFDAFLAAVAPAAAGTPFIAESCITAP
ncbi:MAG: ATP-binding protein [Acetobacteraceae bacterium]|nr:ATP-binding protein [Acetobacteraceae bacterium]